MNFYIRLRVGCEKSGLALLEMYNWLGFHENDRPNNFKTKELEIEVAKEEAFKHRDLFANNCEITINLDLSSTCGKDWIDFSGNPGCKAMGLNDEHMTAERAISLHRMLVEKERKMEEKPKMPDVPKNELSGFRI